MRRTIVILTVFACFGYQRQSRPTTVSATASPSAAIANHVWVRSDSTGLPGVTRILLSDRTLVMDFCWETFQLNDFA